MHYVCELVHIEGRFFTPCSPRDGDVNMDPLSLRLSRIALHGFAHVLGSVGIFCLYWSCVGAPVAAYAFICLGTATAIILSSNGVTRLGG